MTPYTTQGRAVLKRSLPLYRSSPCLEFNPRPVGCGRPVDPGYSGLGAGGGGGGAGGGGG